MPTLRVVRTARIVEYVQIPASLGWTEEAARQVVALRRDPGDKWDTLRAQGSDIEHDITIDVIINNSEAKGHA